MGIMVYSLLWVVQDFVHQPQYADSWVQVFDGSDCERQPWTPHP